MTTPFSLKEKILQQAPSDTHQFAEYIEEMKMFMRDDYEDKDEDYYNLNEKALVGDPTAVAFFMNEINKYISQHPYQGEIPAAYLNLSDALFHEWKGFGPAARWLMDKEYRMSSGLQIIGKQIFYNKKGDFIKYPYPMQTLDRVEQLKRTFLKNDDLLRIDSEDPSAGLKMDDPLWPGRHIRIAIWAEPRVWKGFTTITLRRQIVDYLNLQDQAGAGTIPQEALPMLRLLFGMHLNTVVSGPIGSGKSTFANTIIGEQLEQAVKSVGVAMIESHPESILPYIFKNHRIVPLQAKDNELMNVGKQSLRHDTEIVYMTEMRYEEWEFFNFAAEKGFYSVLGTFHTVDPEDIPYQGAMAAFTQLGGSLKGHLHQTLKAVNLVAVMESFDEGKKVLTRLSEIYYDDVEETVQAIDIMKFNKEKDAWDYNAKISTKLANHLHDRDARKAKLLIHELTRLAGISQISDPVNNSVRCQSVLRG